MSPCMHNPTTICAALNVKNESAVIEKCLVSASRWAACVVIADTGSTDGTQDIVKTTCERLGLELHMIQRPWFNYAKNQTLLLEDARRLSGCDFTWILDADEVVEGEPGQLDPSVDGYHVNRLQDRAWDNWCIRIFNNGRPWEYRGERHAYPTLAA